MYIHREVLSLIALLVSVITAHSLIYNQHAPESSVLSQYVDTKSPRIYSSHQDNRQLIIRILALFTGSSNDLGLDHRLGRQVLKLAAARARRLYPEVTDIQLLIYNDSTECKSDSNSILGVVAQEFYTGQAQDDACDSISSMIGDNLNINRCENLTTSQLSHLAPTDSRIQSKRVDAILGPSCDHLIDSVARMAAYWRTPIYTVTSISGTFGRKDVYPTLTRLSASIDHLSMFVMTVMERFKWRHLAIVVDNMQPENTAILANLERTIDRMRYTIPVDRKTFSFNSFAINLTQNSSQPSQDSAGLDLNQLAVGLDDVVDPPASHQVHCSRESRKLLLSVRRVARVVLLLLEDAQVIRRLLLCAHELRFNNGEYTFLAFNLGLKSSAPSSSSTRGPVSSERQREQQAGGGGQTFNWFTENDEENNLRARQMFESLMVFSVELPAGSEYNIFVEQTLDLARQEYPNAHFDHSSVGLLAVALHDSLLLAVESQRRQFYSSTQRENQSLSTSLTTPNMLDNQSNDYKLGDGEDELDESGKVNRKVQPLQLLWNERYPYGLMSGMHINSNGDQELDYVLSDMEPELGQFKTVASYSKEERQIQMLPTAYIHWPARVNAATQQVLHNDEPPPDEPECGFTGDAQHCVDRQNLFMALTLLALFLLCLAIIAVISYRRYQKIKYQMQLDNYWWKISWADLEFLRAHRYSLSSNLAPSLVRQLKASQDGASVVGNSALAGLGNRPQSLVGSAVSSATGGKSLASSNEGARTLRHLVNPVNSGQGARGASTSDHINKRRSAVSLVVTPASGAGQNQLVHSSQVGTSHEGKSSVFDDHASTRIIRSEFSTVVRVSSLALYKSEIVIVKQLNGSSLEISRNLLIELKGMRELSNENLARLIGLCLDPGHLSIVYEYCSRGNLQDLLLNTSISMDWNLKYSIIGDILNGLYFIHTTLLDYHGRLKSTNLVLDSRFTVKLTDFGLKSLYNQLELIESDDNEAEDEDEGREHEGSEQGATAAHAGQASDAGSDTCRRQSMAPTIYNMDSVSMRGENFATPARSRGHNNLLGASGRVSGVTTAGTEARCQLKNRGSARFFWTAPEHLRQRQPHLAGSKRGDIYSLAIILYEIFTRKQPYHFGTNAKPSWQVIKREKLRHQVEQAHGQQQQQQQHHHHYHHHQQLLGGATSSVSQAVRATDDQLAGSEARKRGSSQTSSGAHHRSSLSSTNRKRRSNASVAPMQHKDETIVESGATHSHASSQLKRGHEQVGTTALDQVKINVTAFGSKNGKPGTIGEVQEEEEEEEEKEEEQQQEEILSIASQHEQGKRKMSATSCLSQELKGDGSVDNGSKSKGLAAADLDGSTSGTTTKLDAEEILDLLRMGVQPEPVRPYIPNYLLRDIDARMVSLLRNCWHEQPSARPTVASVRNTMRKITKGATGKNYLDNLLDRLQTYASQLEMIVDSKSADITAEKERTEELLYQLVPRFVADKLKRSEPIVPQVFDGVTIFFSDIVGFEKYASVMSPCELVDLLNNIYSSFESIISSFDVTKIEVILDQFLVASGISLQEHQQHQQHNAVATTVTVCPEQPTEGARDYADCATIQQIPPSASGEKTKSVKSKRRIFGAIKAGGSQSLETKKISHEDSQDLPGAQSEQAARVDSSHYNRSSCEQIARMALCIRDLVKSFHFRQNLNSIQKQQALVAAMSGAEAETGDDTTSGLAQKQVAAGSFVATTFNIRIGIHSGKVCAGIVGVKRPKFCLIGDTVNVASRMHTNSKANRIQISSSTRELLKQVPGLAIEPRGRIEIKGQVKPFQQEYYSNE